jgi:hypothetical protein
VVGIVTVALAAIWIPAVAPVAVTVDPPRKTGVLPLFWTTPPSFSSAAPTVQISVAVVPADRRRAPFSAQFGFRP